MSTEWLNFVDIGIASNVAAGLTCGALNRHASSRILLAIWAVCT
jgi:hypothetical protein